MWKKNRFEHTRERLPTKPFYPWLLLHNKNYKCIFHQIIFKVDNDNDDND